MPIYAYKCETCGHTKDVLQKMSDPSLVDCLACGAPTFKKQLTAAGFQLKGSGWYVTDFRDGKGGNSKSGDSEKPKEPSDSAKAEPATGSPAPVTAAPSKTDASPASGSAAAATTSPSPAPATKAVP